MHALCLISGGIDSPAALALALEQGHKVTALHFSHYPLGDKRQEDKSRKIIKDLSKKFNAEIKFIVAPHGKSLTEIIRNADRNYSCVLCRRMMLRVAERIAEKEGCDCLLTGESLGQVASQTLDNLKAEETACNIIVARPLLGMDKLEIEEIAKKHGTYADSIQPGTCCEAIPDKPVTKGKADLVENNESNLDLSFLVDNSVQGVKEEVIGG